MSRIGRSRPCLFISYWGVPKRIAALPIGLLLISDFNAILAR